MVPVDLLNTRVPQTYNLQKNVVSAQSNKRSTIKQGIACVSILLEWLVLYPLRYYFSFSFALLMGRSQKFNSYPLGEIFQCRDKISTQNHKSQLLYNIYPKLTLVAEISNVTNCHKSVITKQCMSIDANNLFSHMQSGAGQYQRDLFFNLHFQSLLMCVFINNLRKLQIPIYITA